MDINIFIITLFDKTIEGRQLHQNKLKDKLRKNLSTCVCIMELWHRGLSQFLLISSRVTLICFLPSEARSLVLLALLDCLDLARLFRLIE